MDDINEFRHQVSVKQLKEFLNELKEDDVIVPNSINNLAIYRKGAYIGFIDIGFEKGINLWEERKDKNGFSK